MKHQYHIELLPQNADIANSNIIVWRDPILGDYHLDKRLYTVIIPSEGMLSHFVCAHAEQKYKLNLHSGIAFNEAIKSAGLHIMPELNHSSQYLADKVINFPENQVPDENFFIKYGVTITFSAIFLYALRVLVKRKIIQHQQVIIHHLYLSGFSLRRTALEIAPDGGYVGDLPATMPENQLERLLFSLL